MNETIDWCCTGFRDLCDQYGRRGFGALVSQKLGITAFLLQFRAVDKGNEGAIVGNQSIPVSFAGEMGLLYCPCCGVNLENKYRKQLQRFPERESLLS